MGNFRDLIAWKKAHQLVIEIYKIAKKFPSDEKFILTPQIIRAVISVAANLAEGSKRRSVKDQCHFFNMSETSLEEVKYYIILAVDLNYITKDNSNKIFDLAEEVGRLISGLLKSNS